MDKKYMQEKEIFTTYLKARSRKYYFDIKKKNNGDRYITITELQPNNGRFKRMRVLVFEEYIKEFVEKLNEVVGELGDIPGRQEKERQSERQSERRGNSVDNDGNKFNESEES